MSVLIKEDDAGTKKRAIRSLEKLRRKFQNGDFKAELDRVMNKIKLDAVAMCPKETGTLASTIRLTELPLGMMTGSWSRIKEVMIYNKSIVAGDITKTNPKTKRPCDYASWVHDGHKMRDGRMWNGVPFLTLAIAKNRLELDRAIDRALKKMGSEYSD